MDAWQYDTVEDLDANLAQRLRNFPREPDMLVYAARTTSALALRAWLRLYHRFRIEGREHLRSEKSLVIVANHASHLDALCLLSALPLSKRHRAFPAAAKDYFFENLPRSALAAIVVNALPFDREVSIRQSLSLCRNLLEREGNILVLFPEGTRIVSGELGPFKPGIGLLVAGTPHAVVPCYLDGAYQAWPKGKYFPRPRRVRLNVGAPLNFAHLKPVKAAALEICQQLRDAVEALAPAKATALTDPA